MVALHYLKYTHNLSGRKASASRQKTLPPQKKPNNPALVGYDKKKITPEQVIQMDDDDFKDF